MERKELVVAVNDCARANNCGSKDVWLRIYQEVSKKRNFNVQLKARQMQVLPLDVLEKWNLLDMAYDVLRDTYHYKLIRIIKISN